MACRLFHRHWASGRTWRQKQNAETARLCEEVAKLEMKRDRLDNQQPTAPGSQSVRLHSPADAARILVNATDACDVCAGHPGPADPAPSGPANPVPERSP